jgi:peptidoglycan/LPS O-acetylase OafA/YrhL
MPADPKHPVWPEHRGHVEGFDGLRGIAVLLVVLHHTHTIVVKSPTPLITPIAQAGWVGVDIFFSLSGFLITGLLISRRDKPGYYRDFYLRRLLRIFPLYYLALTLLLAPRLIAGLPTEIPWWAAYGYLTNFWLARHPEVDLQLLITWSLSIEEQFYLLWPFLIAALSARQWRLLVGALLIACPALRWWFFEPPGMITYMDTWFRLDSLAMGAAGAILWHAHDERAVRWARRAAPPLVVLVALLLPTGLVSHRELWWTTFGFPLLAFATTTVLLGLASGGLPRLRQALSWAPLAHVGVVSYGVYLLHPLVLKAIALSTGRATSITALSSPAALGLYALAMITSVAVATLVFRTIEQPILRLKEVWAPYRNDS